MDIKIIKTPIRKKYLYGEKYTHENRYVEVIRVDSCCGQWDTFCFIDGKQVGLQRGISKCHNRSKTECVQNAKKWLNEYV